MTPPFDSNTGGKAPIFHIARNREQRQRDEPNARSGDTEWGICNKYSISFADFRRWNHLPAKSIQSTITIEVGRKYIVGFRNHTVTPSPTVQPTPQPQPQPVVIIRPQPQPQPTPTPTPPPTVVVQPTPQPVVVPTPQPTPQPQPQPQPDPSPGPQTIRKWPAELRGSQRLIDYMKSWERPPMVNGQISGKVFRDTKGGLTIGYGHFIPEHEKWKWREYDPEQGGTREMTIHEMENLFKRDVDLLAEVEIRKRFKIRLLQQEYDALVDFTFHRGGGALRESGLEGYMNTIPDGRYDYNKIKDMFMKYAFWFNKATQQWEFVEGFNKRRKEEINMFQFGIYTLHR